MMRRVIQAQWNLGASLILLSCVMAGIAHSASEGEGLAPASFPDYASLEFDAFAGVSKLEELLTERRFRVEMMVFARADRTGPGAEPLLSITPRQLPQSMFGLSPSELSSTSEFNTAASRHCIGYPDIATEPPLPRKLRTLLNKENEPELSQWYDEDQLGTYPTDLGTAYFASAELADDTFPFNEAAEENRIAKVFTRGTVAPSETAKEPAIELAIEIAIPDNAPTLVPSPYLNFTNQLGAFKKLLRDSSYTAIAPGNFELSNEAAILKRNPKFALLMHQSWQQVVPPRAAPQEIYFTADVAGHSLQGLVSVTLGRYLHFAGQLWLEAPIEEYAAEQLLGSAGPGTFNLQPGNNLARSSVELNADVGRGNRIFTLGEIDAQGAVSEQVPPTAYFELNESRRMRSKELHYLDHPALGIVVKITPLETPESLAEAWANFEEYRQPLERTQ
ncbi:MAG: hypothetical protein ACI8RT_001147 [Candidatus Azotimanducaceae bacterium]|jgi:hypothetical protein|tara:strand:- start:3048 stop:4391 length:1344 start_codon:yes stop_codon:yes gene_type:complete